MPRCERARSGSRVLGRMIGAYRPSASDPQVRGTLFARFGYNAMGQRVTAAYDVDGAPDSLGYPAGDGDLSNNPREVFAYDDKWQLVAVFNQGPVESGTGARPPPVLKERYVYHAAGMRGMSLSQGLDRVVKPATAGKLRASQRPMPKAFRISATRCTTSRTAAAM